MAVLYVTSWEEAVGKTTICVGLAKHLAGEGKRVGFFKPLTGESSPTKGIDPDVAFMKHVLSLAEPVELLCPVITNETNLTDKIKEAYTSISRGKDIVIIEGMWEQGKTGYQIVEALDAKVIIVEGYSNSLSITNLVTKYKDFGEHLLGVVWNKVPRNRLEPLASELSAQSGINILGIIPEDRILFTLSIGKLAEHLQGNILNSSENSPELVENFMLGVMGFDLAPDYFGRKDNKAVVLRGKRSDLQLAALETSTKCLVLTGGAMPIQEVIARAEAKKIPMILVKEDTEAMITSIEDALSRSRFNQEKKLPRLAEIMQQHFNFQALYQGLGLA